MLNDLAELIAIESVLGEPQTNAPFGKNVRAALDWFLQKAKAYGLKTGELDGYCGWAEVGEGKECVGILAHLDVVPASSKGWSNPPFKMTVEGNRVYGRGVADDKGPAVVCLHVLKRLHDEGVKLDRRVRLIVGCNEENGSACMKYYRAHGEIPVVSLTPDADFPVVSSEKTIRQLTLTIPCDDFFTANVTALDGGERPNVVPNAASVTIRDGAVKDEIVRLTNGDLSGLFTAPAVLGNLVDLNYEGRKFGISDDGKGLTLTADGVAGHASEPHKGVNAIAALFAALEPLFGGRSKTLDVMNEYVLSHLAPEKLGLPTTEDESGRLTLNVGTIRYFDGKLSVSLDFRVPKSVDAVAFDQKIEAATGGKVSVIQYTPALFIPENTALVQTLLGVYEEVTGNPRFTVKTGGGTYARELPNAIAYGPTFPHEETNIHNADESIPIEHLELLGEIYYRVMLRLCKG